MKFLNLAISAAIGLAATVASAQTPIPVAYDTYSTATAVSYYTGPGCTVAGDVMKLTNSPLPAPPGPWNPNDTFDTICFLFVATAPGNYFIDVDYLPFGLVGYTFPGSFNGVCPPGIPVTVPAGGTFPSVWEVCICVGTTPLGNKDQAVSVSTSSTTFVPAYVNNAATPAGTDVPANFFSIDTNQNCILEPGPPVNEAYTFANPGVYNLAVRFLTTGCVPAPQFTCNPLAPRSAGVREVTHLKPHQETMLVPAIRTNTK